VASISCAGNRAVQSRSDDLLLRTRGDVDRSGRRHHALACFSTHSRRWAALRLPPAELMRFVGPPLRSTFAELLATTDAGLIAGAVSAIGSESRRWGRSCRHAVAETLSETEPHSARSALGWMRGHFTTDPAAAAGRLGSVPVLLARETRTSDYQPRTANGCARRLPKPATRWSRRRATPSSITRSRRYLPTAWLMILVPGPRSTTTSCVVRLRSFSEHFFRLPKQFRPRLPRRPRRWWHRLRSRRRCQFRDAFGRSFRIASTYFHAT